MSKNKVITEDAWLAEIDAVIEYLQDSRHQPEHTETAAQYAKRHNVSADRASRLLRLAVREGVMERVQFKDGAHRPWAYSAKKAAGSPKRP